jgi:hypothetical protein
MGTKFAIIEALVSEGFGILFFAVLPLSLK